MRCAHRLMTFFIAAYTAVSPVQADGPASALGLTAPSRSATLSAGQPGRLAALCVEEGASVSTGDLLAELDRGAQAARVEIARIEAESALAIERARVRHEVAQRERLRLEGLEEGARVSIKELDDARAAENIARLEMDLAEEARRRAVANYRLQLELSEERVIRAPFDGYIAKRIKEVGESVEARDGVMTLVAVDPLLVIVDCPIGVAARLEEGASATIAPADASDPRLGARVGTIQHVSRVADAASQTVRVKLLAPNSDGAWSAGLSVQVCWPPATRADAGPAACAEAREIRDVQ